MQILRTNSQNRRLYALLNRLKLTEMKANLALQYSDNRTSETSQLTMSECKKLIAYLESQTGPQKKEEVGKDMIKIKRGKCLHLAVAAGMRKGNTKEVDYTKFNPFMMNTSVCKKQLIDYDLQELDSLITQLEQIVKHNKKSSQNKLAKTTVL
jgi:hypothetical protein